MKNDFTHKTAWVFLLGITFGMTGGCSQTPKEFWFTYPHEPSPGKRHWTVQGDTGIVRYESEINNGLESRYKKSGRTVVDGNWGTVMTKVSGDFQKTETRNDGSFQTFVPDVGSDDMYLRFRRRLNGQWERWNKGSRMQGVK